ncbi:MAG: ECF transporter S component [Oscillospiraceae bacterium]|nr:ECF transporter S component [Oscillospiraceae bacterium]
MEYVKSERKSTVNILILTLFITIEIIFCFTPLGSIPFGPGIVATLAHIPVVISALILEKRYSLVMGGIMGLCSFIWWSTIGLANPTSFAFTPLSEFGNFYSIIICLIPRILLPFFTSVTFNLLKRKLKISISAGVAAAFATFLHSVMVLGLIYLFFSRNSNVSESLGKSFISFIIAWAGINSIIEILTAGIIGMSVIIPLKSLKKI